MKLAPLQPVGIAITQVLWFWAHNAQEVAPTDVVRSLTLAAAASLVVWGVASAALRDPRRGAIFASAVAFLFWSTTSMPGGAAAATVIWAASLVALFLWLRRTERPLKRLFRVVDVVAAAGIVVSLAGVAIAGVGRSTTTDPPIAGAGTARVAATSDGRAADTPDVYLIVLDGHGRDDELAEHFGIAQGLGAALERRGFYVARESHANYSATLQAMASILNVAYLPELVVQPTVRRLTALVKNNRLAQMLIERGYRFVSYASGLELTEFRRAHAYLAPPPPVELFGRPLRANDFERALLAWTPFDGMIRRSRDLSPYAQHRERILFALRDMPRHADNPAPTFVFAHLLSPHEPFVFGANGEDVSPHEQSYDLSRVFRDPDLPPDAGRVGPEYARRYREQAIFIGRRVEQTVDEILARSSESPIIIVLGDHGPRGFTPNVRHSRLAILHALHLPEREYDAFYPAITPVNAMRLVLNRYFGERLPLLPDESFRTDWSRPAVHARVETGAR